MRREMIAAALAGFILAACETPAEEPEVAEQVPDDMPEDTRPAVGPAADLPARLPWVAEGGELEIDGLRYRGEQTLMIMDRDRLEPVASRDGIDIFRPDWAADPPERVFVEEEPDRWRPFGRAD